MATNGFVPGITLTTGASGVQAINAAMGASNWTAQLKTPSQSIPLRHAKGDVISKKHKLGDKVTTLEELINEWDPKIRWISYGALQQGLSNNRKSVFVSTWNKVYPISWLVNMRMYAVLKLIKRGVYWLEKY